MIVEGLKHVPSEIGSVAYVLKVLEELPELSQLFQSLTDIIEEQSLQQPNSEFSKLNNQKRITILTVIEQTEPELFKVLKDFTYESHYTIEKVHSLINYEPYLTGTAGPKMEPFSEKLLDSVKSMPPMYIKV